MNRAIWRCWKVDSFLFDWPSFLHSSSHRHLLTILPETAGGRLGGGMRPYYIWHGKSLSVEHGDWWNINCTAQRNSEARYLRSGWASAFSKCTPNFLPAINTESVKLRFAVCCLSNSKWLSCRSFGKCRSRNKSLYSHYFSAAQFWLQMKPPSYPALCYPALHLTPVSHSMPQ